VVPALVAPPVAPTGEPTEARPVDAFLRADAINAQPPHGVRELPRIRKEYVLKRRDREAVSAAFYAAFDLCGGVPNLIQWAASNPDKFFPLYSKFAASDTETPTGGTQINMT
jgi:hypothetical protein